ncbi:conserved hypothetical protein [Coccidioides posadasii str. Silveira]|uniref:Uncharacterized protein n=1 Tax=Coccidioides posadasii (strain RMSCC 757 / Silveira) TaxID=443226 RepID=E9DBW4_COCPS|nr:conserved hypothetical protein [Coccidioides posadasii str. Silveira]
MSRQARFQGSRDGRLPGQSELAIRRSVPGQKVNFSTPAPCSVPPPAPLNTSLQRSPHHRKKENPLGSLVLHPLNLVSSLTRPHKRLLLHPPACHTSSGLRSRPSQRRKARNGQLRSQTDLPLPPLPALPFRILDPLITLNKGIKKNGDWGFKNRAIFPFLRYRNLRSDKQGFLRPVTAFRLSNYLLLVSPQRSTEYYSSSGWTNIIHAL